MAADCATQVLRAGSKASWCLQQRAKRLVKNRLVGWLRSHTATIVTNSTPKVWPQLLSLTQSRVVLTMQDRQHMGLLSAVLDHDRVLYIMTLGVVEGSRHRGIASTLISIACQHAYETRWGGVDGLHLSRCFV